MSPFLSRTSDARPGARGCFLFANYRRLRRAKVPRTPNPPSISAQVSGSGTAVTAPMASVRLSTVGQTVEFGETLLSASEVMVPVL